MAINIFGQRQSKHPAARFFLLFAIPFGLVLSFLTPPFQSPDEPAHFFRAYQVSDFTFSPAFEGNFIGGYLPKSLFRTLNMLDLNNPEPNKKLTGELIGKALNTPLEKKDRMFMMFSNMVLYAPVLYIPQATGIFTGKIFNLPPVVLLYLARIFNLGFWILLMYMAIKWMPFNQWLFAALSITPMAVFLAGSANADIMVMAFTFLFLAWVLKIAFDPQSTFNSKALLMLTFLSVLVALSKNIYVLLSLLVFIIPVSKASGIKDYFLKLSIFFGVTLITAALMYLFVQSILSQIEVIEMYYGGEPFPLINPEKQIAFILSDIPHFIRLVYLSFSESVSMIIKSWIGVLGWLQLFLPKYYYLFALLVIASLAIFSDMEKPSIGWRRKALFLFVLLATLLAFSFTMYCSWTEPGAPRITNLQGRYFIPLAPLALLLFQNRKLQVPPPIFMIIFIVFSIVSMVLSVRMLLMRYYF